MTGPSDWSPFRAFAASLRNSRCAGPSVADYRFATRRRINPTLGPVAIKRRDHGKHGKHGRRNTPKLPCTTPQGGNLIGTAGWFVLFRTLLGAFGVLRGQFAAAFMP